jgi:putative spermidine/putrescine transport system ATP-binding protein
VDIDVELRGVAMAYGATPVLHDLDLAVHKGEFLSLLGPSGCGKTTTLNIIGGFLTPLRGTVKLGGRVVNDVPPYRRNTGMVFQSYALFPHMSVFDNVAFGLKVRRVGAADIARRVREALALVQLEGLDQRAIRQLSGGQQQRVAVARALAGRPSILLADEPTGNLDSNNGDAVMTLLRELHQAGATICMVTHDVRFARNADRTIHLFDGRVVSEEEEPLPEAVGVAS